MPNLHNGHGFATERTGKGVITKRKNKRKSPGVKRLKIGMFLFGNRKEKVFFVFMMLSIKTIIADHLKMLFRDMLNKL